LANESPPPSEGKPPADQPPNHCQLFWLARSLVLLPRVSVKAAKLFMSHPSAVFFLTTQPSTHDVLFGIAKVLFVSYALIAAKKFVFDGESC